MNKAYLPSKQFTARVIILVILVASVFGISKIVTYFKNRGGDKAPTKIAVKEIVQKDTNKNGIPDWEESLWGLDPNKDGPSNKEFILSQRAILAKNEGIFSIEDTASQAIENETFAKEFFAIVMSLQQDGILDQAALRGVSEAVGEKIVATPISDIYTTNMLTLKGDSVIEILEYYTDYFNLNTKYKNKDIGNELLFIAQGIENNDQQAFNATKTVAQAYRSFGSDLIKIRVPAKIAGTHLSLANNYEKVAKSLDGISLTLSDQLSGMKALISYKKYSDLLLTDIEKLSDNFN